MTNQTIAGFNPIVPFPKGLKYLKSTNGLLSCSYLKLDTCLGDKTGYFRPSPLGERNFCPI